MANPYDRVLYEGHPFAQTHPDRLATIATLFGMHPASVTSCRVLELGCGDGGNLIPLAYALPGSEFVGIDAGGAGIEKGCAFAGRLGLRNVRLLQVDIMEETSSLGTFDYIVAHGVYSWVPPEVQARILAICREQLSAHGVAYISYSTYPGAHVKTMVSEMLQYHARRFEEPERQIEQARAFLQFLAGARPRNDGCALLLQQEVESIAARRPATLFHDELAECNAPVYFREFARRAAESGLQYLGEADFFEMQDYTQPAATRAMLQSLARDWIDREQYLDFLKCRRFRQTLLCHAEARIERRIGSSQVRDFAISAGSHFGGEPAPRTPTDHPLAVAAREALHEVWPAALSFGALLDEVRRRGAACADDEVLLADVVLADFACGLCELHVHPPAFVRSVSEYPRASAVARLQAHSGVFVTNLCHSLVRMEDERSLHLLRLLDGTLDREALLGGMCAAFPEVDREGLEQTLLRLAEYALLEA